MPVLKWVVPDKSGFSCNPTNKIRGQSFPRSIHPCSVGTDRDAQWLRRTMCFSGFFSPLHCLWRVGHAGILWFSVHIHVVLTAKGRQQVIFPFVNSIKFKSTQRQSVLAAVLLKTFAYSSCAPIYSPFLFQYNRNRKLNWQKMVLSRKQDSHSM